MQLTINYEADLSPLFYSNSFLLFLLTARVPKVGGESGPWARLKWIYQASGNDWACAVPSVTSGPSPVWFAKHSSSPAELRLLCAFCTATPKPLPCLIPPGIETHQQGLCFPFDNPAVCHPTQLLRPCPELASWTCIFSFVKNTQKPLLSFLSEPPL